MDSLPKCVILPIASTEDALAAAEFLTRLYPRVDHFTVVLSLFLPHLPPIYEDMNTPALFASRRHKLLAEREATARDELDAIRTALIRLGFLNDNILEHLQEKERSVALQTCNLADLQMVDAVVVHRRVTSSLEAFLRGDSTSALIQHCLVSPVWFVEGAVRTEHAAVCIRSGEDSLRALDHALFMLGETRVKISLVHITSSIKKEIICPVFSHCPDLEIWEGSRAGKRIKGFLESACEMIEREDVVKERVQLVILPRKGRMAGQILSYCREQGVGIVVLGHTEPTGILGSIKRSLASALLADFKDLAIWVVQ